MSSTSNNELIAQERQIQYLSPEAERFAMEQRMARLFVASGLFTDIKGQSAEQTVAQAYVKIALGHSMGFSPAESMSGIDIIQGRTAVGSQLRASRMQRSGYHWTIDQLDVKGCKLTIYQTGQRLGEACYVEEDAQRAGLLGKNNWKSDPSAMYFARAITRAQRRYAPGVLSLDVVATEEAIDMEPLPAAVATERTSNALATKMAAMSKPAAQANGPEQRTQAPVPAAQPVPAPDMSTGDLF
jgi:hypothetical protein